MVKRLFVGLVLGAVLGAVIAAVLVQGLGLVAFGTPVVAYLAAAVTGVLAGLVAGKPIWSADGKIEAGLKAFFGALLSLGAMFVLRRWVDVSLDLTAFKAGYGTLGDLPAASLPVIAALLSAFYEVDNSGSDEGDKADGEEKGASAKKGAAKDKKVRVSAAEEEVDEEDAEEPAAKKRRR
jgi:hypothetical protein